LGDIHRSYIGPGLNPSAVQLVHKFAVQPKFVQLVTELVIAAERVLSISSLNSDVAIGPQPTKHHQAYQGFNRDPQKQAACTNNETPTSIHSLTHR